MRAARPPWATRHRHWTLAPVPPAPYTPRKPSGHQRDDDEEPLLDRHTPRTTRKGHTARQYTSQQRQSQRQRPRRCRCRRADVHRRCRPRRAHRRPLRRPRGRVRRSWHTRGAPRRQHARTGDTGGSWHSAIPLRCCPGRQPRAAALRQRASATAARRPAPGRQRRQQPCSTEAGIEAGRLPPPAGRQRGSHCRSCCKSAGPRETTSCRSYRPWTRRRRRKPHTVRQKDRQRGRGRPSRPRGGETNRWSPETDKQGQTQGQGWWWMAQVSP